MIESMVADTGGVHNNKRGVLRKVLFPLVIALRLAGGYSGSGYPKFRTSYVFGILQTLWGYTVLFIGTVFLMLRIADTMTENSCKLTDFLGVVSIITRAVFAIVGMFIMMRNIGALFENECKTIDMLLSKYWSRRDKYILKMITVLILVVTGIQICLVYIIPFRPNITTVRDQLLGLLPVMSNQTGTVVSWILRLLYNAVYVCMYCGEVFITILCACLAITFKRIQQQLPVIKVHRVTDPSYRRMVNLVKLWMLVEDHSMLCEMMEAIEDKISVLLLFHACSDTFWTLNMVYVIKDGHLNTFVSGANSAYGAYVAIVFLYAGLRMGALVYLSDQVCS